MVLKMVRPTSRKGSSKRRYRCRVPKAIQGFAQGTPVVIPFPASSGEYGEEPAYTAQATLGKEQVSFSLGTGDELVAKERNAIADQYMERLFSTLKAQKGSGGVGGVTLTSRQCRALAGQWYAGFVASYENDQPAGTDHVSFMEALEAHARYLSHMDHYSWKEDGGSTPEEDNKVHYDLGLTRLIRKEMLVPHGLAGEPDAATWDRLVQAFTQTVRQGLATVKRYAEGDYSPDAVLATFPALDLRAVDKLESSTTSVRKKADKASLTFDELLTQWWASVQPTGMTLNTKTAYEKAFKALAKHAGHTDAQRITKADIEAFRDDRLAEGKAHKTVSQQMNGISSVYNWAVEKKIITINPAKGLTMPKRRQIVTEDKDFTDEEAKAILRASSENSEPVKRWVPWLCAYTGARVGEILQLRTQDIRQDAKGGWLINITPEAGTVKTKQFREVPLHDHLIDQGFTRWVQEQEGYLFLDVALDANEEDKAKARRVILGKVGRFAKAAGNISGGKRPNHGWRHTFKTIGREAGISEHTLDALCGHTPSTVGASYGKVSLRVKREAINRLPRFAAVCSS